MQVAFPQELPETHRALVLSSPSQPPEVRNIPTPQPCPAAHSPHRRANIFYNSREIYNRTGPYPFPMPLVTGTSAVGRIAAAGSDAVMFKPGQLVPIDSFIRARDNPRTSLLMDVHEGFTDGSRKLMRGEWRDGTHAKYAKIPLENCHLLNESVLVRKYGIKIGLCALSQLVVPYDGLADMDLRPGETIIVAPVTSPISSVAVKVALAMGAHVIAMGPNVEILKYICRPYLERIETVQITGDVQVDTKSLQSFGPIDAYLDISPADATNSTHFRSCILALRHGGRISFMASVRGDLALPVVEFVRRNLQMKGKWVYSIQNIKDLIKMVEYGVLKLGDQKFERFAWRIGRRRLIRLRNML
ncbi:alcohol dehydrogenase [Bisporella sp. PMI_857]|nr:alcohol dehydrogenase [Bisporella sp. PMI_857]